MTSVCWSCRLKLLTSTSRVPFHQQRQSLTPPVYSTTRLRDFHSSSARRLPRTRGRTPSTESLRQKRGATGHRVEAQTDDEYITAESDAIEGDHNARHSRRRRHNTLEARQKVEVAQRSTNIEANVRLARQTFGDTLPEGLLDEDGMRVYERLYGPPSRIVGQEEIQREQERQQRELQQDAKLMRETERGGLEEVGAESDADVTLAEGQHEVPNGEQETVARHGVDDQLLLAYGEALAAKAENEDLLIPEQRDLLADDQIREAFEARSNDFMHEDEDGYARDGEEEDDLDKWPGDENRVRTHPLTAMGRFCTYPTAIRLPKASFIDPVTKAIAPVTTRQLRIAAEQIFDGPGLPYSPATPRRSLTMPQKPIPLQAGSKNMNDMESFVYAATVMPAVYASVLGILTEVRKRLGKSWLRGLMGREGGPLILDAGAGGAGALAWRDVLKAEWESMHEEAVAAGGEHRLADHPPVGKATVLTASSALRNRATRMLDDTSFIPRMPEAVKPDGHEQRKQYDLIIASHMLWPLEKDYMRKLEVDKLWSLLKPDGGVLVLLEKGVPRGFEVIAGARAHLLKKRIASPSDETGKIIDDDIYSRDDNETVDTSSKEQGMIIAPCTNHGACPMYKYAGVSQARKDWCYFSQRFIRPPFLQHTLGAKQVDHDDVEFSYVAVQRGKDLRQESILQHENEKILGATAAPVQDTEATDAAFQGYEAHPITAHSPPTMYAEATTEAPPSSPTSETETPLAPHPLSLPRLILPALKRPKHIILDVCTPAATLERWVVTKGFSAQAYRDARKSSWGDLWALGAKSRSAKRVNLGKQAKQLEEMERRRTEGKKRAEADPGMNVEIGKWRKKQEKHKRKKEGRKKLDLLDY